LKLDWRRSKVLVRLSGPKLFDVRFFWSTYFIAFILQITLDVIAYDSPSWLWLPVWTVGHLLATLVAIVIRKLFLDEYLEKKPNPFLNILVAMILGIVRVTFIGWASFELELQGLFDLGARIIAGAISGFVGFIVIVNYTESSRAFSKLANELEKTQSQLRSLRKTALDSARSSQLQAQKKIEEFIEPRLRDIAKLIESKKVTSSSRSEIAGEIKNLLDGEVKNLSKSFQAPTKALQNQKSFRPVSRTILYRFPKLVFPHLALRPFLISLVAMAGVPFSMYVFEDASWLSVGFLLILLDLMILGFAKLLLKTLPAMKLINAVIVLVLIAIVTVVIDYPMLVFAKFPEEDIPFIVLISAATIFGTMTGFGLVAVHDANRDDYVSALRKNNNRIERELALLNQKIWVEKRKWALRIHGTVQASLTAALARLSKPGSLSAQELKLIKQHISQARKGLAANETNFNLRSSLKQIRDTWEGLIEVRIDLRSDAAKALLQDSWAGVCANEIVKESVSNSLKHGKATIVDVYFESAESGFVRIIAEDNGKGLPNQFRPGLGSQILDEVAYPWSLTKKPEGGTRLEARIPVAKISSTANRKTKG
jgi:signal transduction histidine kinase